MSLFQALGQVKMKGIKKKRDSKQKKIDRND